MKGLILKDFYSLKIYIKTLFLMVVIYALLGYFSGSSTMLTSLVAVLSMILPITSFTYDKYYKWEEYALSLPLRRSQIVLAKYIFTALILLFAFVLTVLLSVVTTYFYSFMLSSQQLWEIAATNYYTVGILLLLPAILLPVMFRFGPDKGRVALFVVLGAFSLLVVAAAQFVPQLIPGVAQAVTDTLSNEWAVIAVLNVLPLVTLLLFVLSYFLSCRFYQKREL